MHDAIQIGLPLIVIIAGILFNKQDLASLRADIRADINKLDLRIDQLERKVDTVQRDIDGRLDSIQRDMREFYAEQARHDVRITALEQQK